MREFHLLNSAGKPEQDFSLRGKQTLLVRSHSLEEDKLQKKKFSHGQGVSGEQMTKRADS